MPARLHLARPQHEPLADLQPPGHGRQRRFAHELGAGAGERAFVGLGPARVQGFGHDQAKHRVAEELQPFVVRRAGAAVGQRLGQQGRRGEDVPGEPVGASVS